MLSDPWLDRWIPLIAERAAGTPVLEIGCGYGDDTLTLTKAGFDVIAFDRSAACVAAARLRAPRARVHCSDIRDAFPQDARDLGAVVASLSLHYFPWEETVSIVGRIREALKPRGVLLCRLNSTLDHNFGAGDGARIEENFHSIDGRPKRFFDKASLERLFGDDWRRVSMEHMTSRKYFKQKALWEVVLEHAGLAERGIA